LCSAVVFVAGVIAITAYLLLAPNPQRSTSRSVRAVHNHGPKWNSDHGEALNRWRRMSARPVTDDVRERAITARR
jgi:hypothetical protein